MRSNSDCCWAAYCWFLISSSISVSTSASVFPYLKPCETTFSTLSSSRNSCHSSGYFVFVCANSAYPLFGQNQHPPRFDISYVGESKPHSLQRSYAACSVYPNVSRSDILFEPLNRSSRFGSFIAIPTYCRYSAPARSRRL